MPLTSHAFRDIAASVTLTCFAIGLFSAHGAQAVETHIAVSDARAAARALDANREELEQSLAKAESLAEESAAVADEEQVAQAAAALDAAMTDASITAGVERATVASQPIVVDGAVAAAESIGPMAPSPSPSESPSTPSASTPAPAPTPGAGARSDEAEVDPVIAGAAEDAERVLTGHVDTADEARQATARLAEANVAIDAAAKDVASETAALAVALEQATLAENLVVLDALTDKADARADLALDLTAAVGRRVTSTTDTSDAFTAQSSLQRQVEHSRALDRSDPSAVATALDSLTDAAATMERALAAVEVTHQEWIATENDRRDAINEERLADHQDDLDSARAAHVAANHAAVAAHPNGWTGQPTGVSGSNGSLAPGSLCDVAFLPGALLQCDAAAALEEANEAYRAQTGRDLAVTDTYRSYGLQVATRYRKPTTAAMPGTSNHGWGMAIDLDSASSEWLRSHGEDFGWLHPAWAKPGGARPESWHLEYVASAVGAFEPPAVPELLEHAQSAFETVADAD